MQCVNFRTRRFKVVWSWGLAQPSQCYTSNSDCGIQGCLVQGDQFNHRHLIKQQAARRLPMHPGAVHRIPTWEQYTQNPNAAKEQYTESQHGNSTHRIRTQPRNSTQYTESKRRRIIKQRYCCATPSALWHHWPKSEGGSSLTSVHYPFTVNHLSKPISFVPTSKYL